MSETSLAGKRVVLGVCGGIAAYKAAALASLLTQRGAIVRTVLTRGAVEFITPLTFQSITRQPVYTDVFEERDAGRISHIALADDADLIVIAPATADTMAKVAHGFGDDMLTTVLLAARCPVMFAPAMNVHMYENAIVKRNLAILRDASYHVLEPGVGRLACGYNGRGRLLEPEEIAEYMEAVMTPARLQGQRVLITAGPTQERLDPVRYLTNDSTGTMGFALARAAWRMGAAVTLIAGPVSLPTPLGVDRIDVQTAQQMGDAVLSSVQDADILIMTAAVADYRPADVSPIKIKKSEDTLTLALVRNPDVLRTVADSPNRPPFVVGFAAETHDAESFARKKLVDKSLDMVALNHVLTPGAGFGTSTNEVTVLMKDGETVSLPMADKLVIAHQLCELIAGQAALRMRGCSK